MIKRLFDLLLSALALLLLSPLLLGTALAVWWEDGWPVLFRQVRVGRHGREFGMYKFRSMVKNAAAIGPITRRLMTRASPAWAASFAAPASMNCRNCSMCCWAT